VSDKREREITAEFMEEQGITGELIYGRYAGIGRVLESHYLEEESGSYGSYEPDNPTGFRTGQCINVQVIEGVVYRREIFHQGEIVEGICSYGGDVGIVGKPQVGDIVGFYFGYYVQIWENVEAPYQPSPSVEPVSKTAASGEEKVISSFIDMEHYKQASNLEMSNAEQALKLYEKLEDANSKFYMDIFLAGVIGFVIGYIIVLFGGQSWGIEKDSPVLPLIWYYIGLTITILLWAPRDNSWTRGARLLYVPIVAIVIAAIKFIEVAFSFVIVLLIAAVPIFAVYTIISVVRYFLSEGPFVWVLPLNTVPAVDWTIYAICFTASFLFLAVFDVSIPKTLSVKRVLRVMRLKKRESLSTIVLLISMLSVGFGWYSDNVFYYNLIVGIILSVITGGLIGFSLACLEKDKIIANLCRLAKARCLVRMNYDFETYFPLRYVFEDRKVMVPGSNYVSDEHVLENLMYATIVISENRELKKRRTLFKWAPWGVYIGSHEFHSGIHTRSKPSSRKEFLAYTDEARRLMKDNKYDVYREIIADNIEKTEQLWLLGKK